MRSHDFNASSICTIVEKFQDSKCFFIFSSAIFYQVTMTWILCNFKFHIWKLFDMLHVTVFRRISRICLLYYYTEEGDSNIICIIIFSRSIGYCLLHARRLIDYTWYNFLGAIVALISFNLDQSTIYTVRDICWLNRLSSAYCM